MTVVRFSLVEELYMQPYRACRSVKTHYLLSYYPCAFTAYSYTSAQRLNPPETS